MTALLRIDRLARLMAADLQFIEPLHLVEQKESLIGRMTLVKMPRLKSLLGDENGSVDYRLDFGRDEQGQAYIEGEISAGLTLICQRCMSPVDVPLQNKVNIGIVADKTEAERLPRHFEPLIIVDSLISLPSLIEDEVLLGLPMAPAHKIDQCPSRQLIKDHTATKHNPFEALKDLKLKS